MYSPIVNSPLSQLRDRDRTRMPDIIINSAMSPSELGNAYSQIASHLPALDKAKAARQAKDSQNHLYIIARETRRRDRDMYQYAEKRTILPPKEEHHSKHLHAYTLVERFPPGLHTAVVMRDENIAALPENLDYMAHITKIDLEGNKITTLPVGIGNLPLLTELDVTCNYLTELPQNITNLTRLVKLKARYNQIAQLPELDGMHALVSLDVSHNLLEELPDSIRDLRKLESLDVRNCHLRYLPETLNDMRNSLSEVLADFNYIVAFPHKINNMHALRTFSLTQNKIRSLRMGSMENSTNLETLNLNFNALVSVPKTIGLMYGLKSLDLASNLLEEAPRSLAVLTGLTQLDLSKNKITELPVFTRLTMLKVLKVEHNHLEALSMGLHKMTALTTLEARGNPNLKTPPLSVVYMGLPHVMEFMEREDGRQMLLHLRDKKLKVIMDVIIKHFKHENTLEEAFRLLDNGEGVFGQSAFGVWTRVVGLGQLRASEVNFVYGVMDEHHGRKGTVPIEAVMNLFKKFKYTYDEQSHVPEEESKEWQQQMRQIITDFEMEEAAMEAEKQRKETLLRMKMRRRQRKAA